MKSQIGHALAGCHPSPVTAHSPAVVGRVHVVMLLVGGLDHVGRLLGLRSALEGAAADISRANEGSEPFQVLRRAQPRRRVGRTALDVLLGHRGLLVGLYGGGSLRWGVAVKVVEDVQSDEDVRRACGDEHVNHRFQELLDIVSS
ncbi:hypothetical protein [Streptomyces olivaceus]|uniref:hypothetical protein n=1 Tax=Streptomyces olivaceus TaxID=47716 RepID=UPI004057B672